MNESRGYELVRLILDILLMKYLEHEIDCFEKVTAEPGGDHENTEPFDASRNLIGHELRKTDSGFDWQWQEPQERAKRRRVFVDTEKR